MTQLGPTARSLISAARDGLGDPDAATAARVRAKIAASIGGTVAGAATQIPASKIATVAIKRGMLAAGLAVGAIIAVAVTSRTVTPVPGMPAFAEATETATEEPRGRVHVAIPDGVAGRAASPPDNDVVRRPDIVIERPTLAREVELIDAAMAELRLAHFATALQTIAMFRRETAGHGQLAEDAAAIAIETHCHLHDRVTDLLDVFDRTWPSSAQRARLTAACGR